MAEEKPCHGGPQGVVEEAVAVLQRDLFAASTMLQRMCQLLEDLRVTSGNFEDRAKTLTDLQAMHTGLRTLSMTCEEGHRLTSACMKRLLGTSPETENNMKELSKPFAAFEDFGGNKTVHTNARKTNVEANSGLKPAERIVDALRNQVKEMQRRMKDAIQEPPSGHAASRPTLSRHKECSANREQVRARRNAWHSSSAKMHGSILARANHSRTSTGNEAADHDKRHKRRQTCSLSPPRSCPSRAWPPLFISHASRMSSQSSGGGDMVDPTGLTATDGDKDVSGDEIQKYQLDQLEIVSMALDELGAIVLRASVADHLKDERHSSECKEHESKLKQLKQACRQLQRDAKASRESRTELASQMATLQLQYQSLLDASEKQRAAGQAASRKYDALVLKSVSLIQQLEGRLHQRPAEADQRREPQPHAHPVRSNNFATSPKAGARLKGITDGVEQRGVGSYQRCVA